MESDHAYDRQIHSGNTRLTAYFFYPAAPVFQTRIPLPLTFLDISPEKSAYVKESLRFLHTNFTDSSYNKDDKKEGNKNVRSRFSDSETAAVRKELRSMKRTFRIGLAACAFLSGVIGFSAGTLAAKSQKGSVVVQSVERRPQNLENIPVTSINIPSVAALTQNSVVEIRTESVTNSLFLRQFVTEGAGSGVIISEDGYIVTTNLWWRCGRYPRDPGSKHGQERSHPGQAHWRG